MKINFGNIGASAGRAFGRVKYTCVRNAPVIFFVIGAASVIAGTVVACKQTKKASEAVEECKKNCEHFADQAEKGEYEHTLENGETMTVEYNKTMARRDIVVTTIKTGGKVLMTYAPAILLELAGFGCFLGSSHILSKRLGVALGMVAGLQTQVDGIMQRVEERYGSEVAREIRYGLEQEEVKKEFTDPETGEVKTFVDKNVKMTTRDMYTFIVDETNHSYWDTDYPEFTLAKLREIQQLWNMRLKDRGKGNPVYFDEVLRSLDLYDYNCDPEFKRFTHTVCWMYDSDGDNYIDFGLEDYKPGTVAYKDFINGFSPFIILEFNCDGDVFSKDY